MRLIDADNLKIPNDAPYKASVKRVVAQQPTVEAKEVVHAEWRHLGGDEWCCTECGYVISTEGSWENPKAKFCEECGADMRGKKNVE